MHCVSSTLAIPLGCHSQCGSTNGRVEGKVFMELEELEQLTEDYNKLLKQWHKHTKAATTHTLKAESIRFRLMLMRDDRRAAERELLGISVTSRV
jgi:hypothetical protein